ncbi:MAG: dephospho-CoA kinase [Acidobacteriota bacterium]
MILSAGLYVGLTGGIASGKSTIARMFAGLGCTAIDADAIVADLYRPGAAGHQALVRTYGAGILDADGAIGRRKLGDLAFSSSEAARRLNALIHPLVLAEERRILAAFPSDDDRIVIVEATLLIEAGSLDRFDRIIVVDVPPEVQIARGVARGMAREEVVRRIAHQLARQERLRHADYVIDNSGDEAAALEEVRRVHQRLREDLRKKKGTG